MVKKRLYQTQYTTLEIPYDNLSAVKKRIYINACNAFVSLSDYIATLSTTRYQNIACIS